MTGEHPVRSQDRSDPASTADRITQAATHLISEHGLGGVTMSGVALAAGVSRQTLYNHFADVEGIVAAAILQHNREGVALLEAALEIGDSPRGKLEQLVRHFVMLGAHGHSAAQIEPGLSADTRADLGVWDEAVNDRIQEVLEVGVRTGDFRADLVPTMDPTLIRHLLDGIQSVTAFSPQDSARVAQVGIRTVLAAVAEPGATDGKTGFNP
jgi:AcrR family transcriptional regulator